MRGAATGGDVSIRVALIDDQDLVREGIKSLLALSGEVAVPVEGRHGDDLLQADLSAVDVVVMDIRMPGRDGLSALRELRRRGDPRPVLMLTTFEEPELFQFLQPLKGTLAQSAEFFKDAHAQSVEADMA